MTRRRNLLLVAAGVVLWLGVSPYVFFHPRRLNHDGFAAIQVGMTPQEVEQLLGGPPGIYYPSYPGSGGMLSGSTRAFHPGSPAETEMVWYDDERRYEVWFKEGRVTVSYQRSPWSTSAHPYRLDGWVSGHGEPSPLKPRLYQAAPPAR